MYAGCEHLGDFPFGIAFPGGHEQNLERFVQIAQSPGMEGTYMYFYE